MLKKVLISVGVTIVFIYAVFLSAPLFLSSVINSLDIPKMVEDASGFKLSAEKIQIFTAWNLSGGVKLKEIVIKTPDNESFLNSGSINVRIALIPLIFRKIQLDKISIEDVNLNLKIKKDGRFVLEDYFQGEQKSESSEMQSNSLPYGFKLSNHLPDIIVKNYNISFVDAITDKSYSVYGEVFKITDFIFNKKFKLYALGKIQLEDLEQFSYDIKIFNKVMPSSDLNDVVFTTQEVEENSQTVNLIDIFKVIRKNLLKANIKANIETFGTFEDIKFKGDANVSDFSITVDGKKLPDGIADIHMNGNKIKLYSKLYTASDEITEIVGNFKTGKTPFFDVNFKSNAKFNSIIDLADSVAKSFGCNKLDTLSATGGVDADFSVKSNLKNVESSGYLKIPSATLAYRLYNISIDKIFADIQFANNIINIKDSGLTILNQPLKIAGTISSDANCDLNVLADKLPVKGLLLALGQINLLKENLINSGLLSANVILKGRLDQIVPKININIDNLNLKNVPSNTIISLLNSKIDLTTNGVKTSGMVNLSNLKIINPMASIALPSSQIKLGEKDIDISKSHILFNNSKIDFWGKGSDYMTKTINFDVSAQGNVLASDIKSVIPKEYRTEVLAKGALPISATLVGTDKTQDINIKIHSDGNNYAALLDVEQLRGKGVDIIANLKLNGDTLKISDAGVYSNNQGFAYLKGAVNDLYKSQALNLNLSVPSKISMAIPYVPKSKLTASGNVDISGTALNPILKGGVSIPLITMPDITLKDMSVTLNGAFLKGKGTLKSFVCGGIAAENLASDFDMVNNIFNLKNLAGDAFKGKVSGNISYNIINGNIKILMKGTGLDAESAIAGAAGLKNAMSGILNFNANVTTKGDTDIKLMQNLKGNADFEIKNGEFGNIGRFDNYILAQNLIANPIIKAAVNSVRSIPVIKNTAQYEYVKGNLTFDKGWASLAPVKTSGPSMAYYINGKYNLINATANLVVLGRISADVVKLLGPLGELSLSKLTSLIPGVGNSTVALVRAITTNPYGEKVSEIPPLSSGNTNFKNFKVQFNGGIESSSSVKSFKWLSVCDTSEIESFNIKDQIQTTKQAIKDAKQQQIDNANKLLEERRKQAQEDAQQVKDAVEGLKNLFKPKNSNTEIESPAEE